ncbi:hypothetical protein [Lapidilactobacillus wuchangensis]|uniref:hypothetical protein n=1 Tax=Lapidilactobacillus wuchangensis TaxID=2486001 RepID=UPI000F78C74A|nr:hypothetical protein [Lapidilactobacillus wuchangensis]
MLGDLEGVERCGRRFEPITNQIVSNSRLILSDKSLRIISQLTPIAQHPPDKTNRTQHYYLAGPDCGATKKWWDNLY